MKPADLITPLSLHDGFHHGMRLNAQRADESRRSEIEVDEMKV